MSEYSEARAALNAARAGAKENHGSAAAEAAAAYRRGINHDNRRGTYYLWAGGGAFALLFLYLVLRSVLIHLMGDGGLYPPPATGTSRLASPT